MKNYQGTRAVPGKENLSSQQYLMWLLKYINPVIRTKLQPLDESLISQKEIAELEKIINSSSELKTLLERNTEIQEASYLTKEEKKTLEKGVVDKLYKNIGRKHKKKFSKRGITIIMHRLNIGPWRQHSGGGIGDNGIVDFISRNRELFEDNQSLATNILERYYASKIQSTRTIAEAREVLQNL